MGIETLRERGEALKRDDLILTNAMKEQQLSEMVQVQTGILNMCKDIQATLVRLQSRAKISVGDAQATARKLVNCREYLILISGGQMPSVKLARPLQSMHGGKS